MMRGEEEGGGKEKRLKRAFDCDPLYDSLTNSLTLATVVALLALQTCSRVLERLQFLSIFGLAASMISDSAQEQK